MTPSSSSSAAEICIGQPLADDVFDARDAVLGADHHQHIAGTKDFGGPGGGEDLFVADDRDDRRAGTGPGPGIA